MIDPQHYIRPAPWHHEIHNTACEPPILHTTVKRQSLYDYSILRDGTVVDHRTGKINRPRKESMTEIRLELTEATQLQDIIEFAALAKRYGDKTHREIVQPTEGNRHRMMLVFKTQHSKLNTEPAPAKRTPRVV